MGRDDRPLLIDVLPQVSFQKQHLPLAEHASFYETDFLEGIASLVDSTDDSIVLYCLTAGCDAAARAASTLADAGYSQVFVLAGGLRAWEEEGGAVARERG